MRILICDGLDDSGLELFRGVPEFEPVCADGWDLQKITAELVSCDALVVRSKTRVTAEMLKNAIRLKVIGRAGMGVDNIDVQSASARGILVMNTPGGNAMAAAEHTLALMLALARHVPQAAWSMKQGHWEKSRFVGTELYEQTLGVIGLGRIGSIVAQRAVAMGMQVLASDPYISPDAASERGIRSVSLDELFSQSHFITLHTPSTPETHHIVNREALSKMRRGVRIINAARGELVDEFALYDAVQSGHVAGAALDVFSVEPPNKDNPLLSLENVICTPHLGASSIQAQANVSRNIALQIIDYLKQGIIRNAVNFPSISLNVYEKLRPYLTLGEALGRLQSQLLAPIDHVEIEYCGPDFNDLPLEPITQAVAKGLLDTVLDQRVNLVNAPILLKERQISLTTSTTVDLKGYTGMITVRVEGAGQKSSASGTVFPGEAARLIRLDNYLLEAELKGINLIIQNLDRPGVIGLIGSSLGGHNLNISNMHLSRTPERDKAMAIVSLDEVASAELIEALRANPSILSVYQVIL